MKRPVAIIMGSQTDLEVMQEAVSVLNQFKIKTHIEIVSAHRTPEKMVSFAKNAHKKYSVIIAGAGGAAHLPGMVASLTTLPVIGVPVQIGSLKGLDALLSIAQMPKGIPVATVAVDQAANAGLLAARILSVSDKTVQKKLSLFQKEMKSKVSKMNKALQKAKK